VFFCPREFIKTPIVGTRRVRLYNIVRARPPAVELTPRTVRVCCVHHSDGDNIKNSLRYRYDTIGLLGPGYDYYFRFDFRNTGAFINVFARAVHNIAVDDTPRDSVERSQIPRRPYTCALYIHERT